MRLLYSVGNALAELSPKRVRNSAFVFTRDLEESLEITDNYVTLMSFLRQIKYKNGGIAPRKAYVLGFLVRFGVLEKTHDPYYRSIYAITQMGKEYDLKSCNYVGSHFRKSYIQYGRKGQELIVKLLKEKYGEDVKR